MQQPCAPPLMPPSMLNVSVDRAGVRCPSQECGCDGLGTGTGWVSNHGDKSLEAIPDCRQAWRTLSDGAPTVEVPACHASVSVQRSAPVAVAIGAGCSAGGCTSTSSPLHQPSAGVAQAKLTGATVPEHLQEPGGCSTNWSRTRVEGGRAPEGEQSANALSIPLIRQRAQNLPRARDGKEPTSTGKEPSAKSPP